MATVSEPINARDIAQLAAQGVADALASRRVASIRAGNNPDLKPPWKIIIGLIFPKGHLFEASLSQNGAAVIVDSIEPHLPGQ